MHPSWRDLVIDRLTAHQPSRRKFLERTGISGFLLALSSAGGATGGRELPLLRNEEDWRALSAAIPRVLRSERFAVWRVLTSLQSALLGSTDARPAAGATERQITNLAEKVLASLRDGWGAGENPPSAAELDLYYGVSECIAPLPQGPDLRLIWEAAWKAARSNIAKFDPTEIEMKLDELLDWAQIASSISENEPRFLRQVWFPENYVKKLTPLIPLLKERVALRFDLDYEYECTDEEGRMNTISLIASRIAEHTADLEVEALALVKLAKENELRAEKVRRELEERATEEEREEREKDYRRTAPPESAVAECDPLESIIDVGELFRDL
jgi:hypothetical protein